MAIDAPRLRERFELISEGYKNGIASQDKPYDVLVGYRSKRICRLVLT